MTKYKYVGCFLEYEDFFKKTKKYRTNSLETEITTPHITFQYKPDFVDTKLFGAEISVTVTGYGVSDDNEGFLVELESNNSRINEMIKKIPVPHITLSISKNGKAVNTRYLSFEKTEPVHLKGYYGGYKEGE